MTDPVRMVDASGHGATWTTEQLFVDVYEPLGWLRAAPDEDEPGDGVPLGDDVFLIPGPRGADGPPGPPGDLPYEHVQDTESDDWIVNHNRGRVVAVTVLTPGLVEQDAEVVQPSLNQVRVRLATPQRGFALVH